MSDQVKYAARTGITIEGVKLKPLRLVGKQIDEEEALPARR